MDVIGTSDAFQRARKLRRAMTKPERLLWWALKADQTGFHFRKQHAAGPYVLDFYCDRARLCVEVDGLSHDFTVNRVTRAPRQRPAIRLKMALAKRMHLGCAV